MSFRERMREIDRELLYGNGNGGLGLIVPEATEYIRTDDLMSGAIAYNLAAPARLEAQLRDLIGDDTPPGRMTRQRRRAAARAGTSRLATEPTDEPR